MRPDRPRVLALVLAGGEGGRLTPLTSERAKPALPYGGVYRLIDFPMSNCLHSGITDVWLLQQYEPHELTRQVANGRPWDLDRTYGGLRVMHPHLGGESGWYEGNADALFHNREAIRSFEPDVVIVLSADHVYKLDYADVVTRHRESGASVTMVTTKVPVEEAGRYGTVTADGDGRVTGFEYKPDDPRTGVVGTEVFVYDAADLLETLDDFGGTSDGSEIGDFGDVLLPRLVGEGKARAYELDGYWRDVGTVESYWQSHMELLGPEPPFGLDDAEWPILTLGVQRPPALVERTAAIDRSWLSPGAVVGGSVERCVLGPGVVVEPGAVVRESVLFHDTIVEAGATVQRTVVDERVRVGEKATVGNGAGEVTVIGGRAEIPAEKVVEAGERVDPATAD